ncbi:uncharacterized protein isoform X2 [Salmo salar]|uniref:Uncharacterized protein isoform X2 n=1 Tax=Salmo salar TaxID=8030 RepID=A0ABM3DD17_SALSA|nr:uncharacterized protein LOC106578929 isoform X2 [Salmo salar]
MGIKMLLLFCVLAFTGQGQAIPETDVQRSGVSEATGTVEDPGRVEDQINPHRHHDRLCDWRRREGLSGGCLCQESAKSYRKPRKAFVAMCRRKGFQNQWKCQKIMERVERSKGDLGKNFMSIPI